MSKHPILYLVSFADSKVYRIPYNDRIDIKSHLDQLSSKIKNFLNNKYPDEPIAYYTSPKVEEIFVEEDAQKYASYPLLDAAALKAIETKLGKEIADEESLNRLNSDAPFSDIL